jgi:hypothetical protein
MRVLLVVASVLTCAVGCSAPAAKPAAPPSERTMLLTDALAWSVPKKLGGGELADWVIVVDAGADSTPVVQQMGHPSFTTAMPADVERGPFETIDTPTGRRVVRFNLKVAAVSESSATVVVTYYSGTRSANQTRLELVPEAEGWRVVSDQVEWTA